MTVNQKYIGLQGLYWMLYCATVGYFSVYLQDRGMSAGGIGLVIATSGLISAILQPVIGRMCDRSEYPIWKDMLLRVGFCIFFVCVLMLFIPGKWTGALFMGLLFLGIKLMMPLLNGAMSYYQSRQEYINFGVARGTGSGLFALLALLLGQLVAGCGAQVVPAAGMMIAAAFLFAVRQMPCERGRTKKTNEKAGASSGFVRRYPAFLVMTAAFALMAIPYNTVELFLLQIIQALGGDSRQFGTATAMRAILELPVLFGFSWLLKKYRPKALMAAAAAGYVIKIVAYALARSIAAVYLVQFTQLFSFAIYAAASVYYVMETVDDSDQVTGQALMTDTMAVGNVLGSLFGGWMINHFGIFRMLQANVAFAAVGMVLVLISVRMPSQNRDPAEGTSGGH